MSKGIVFSWKAWLGVLTSRDGFHKTVCEPKQMFSFGHVHVAELTFFSEMVIFLFMPAADITPSISFVLHLLPRADTLPDVKENSVDDGEGGGVSN